jgi:hypothetical protein
MVFLARYGCDLIFYKKGGDSAGSSDGRLYPVSVWKIL